MGNGGGKELNFTLEYINTHLGATPSWIFFKTLKVTNRIQRPARQLTAITPVHTSQGWFPTHGHGDSPSRGVSGLVQLVDLCVSWECLHSRDHVGKASFCPPMQCEMRLSLCGFIMAFPVLHCGPSVIVWLPVDQECLRDGNPVL